MTKRAAQLLLTLSWAATLPACLAGNADCAGPCPEAPAPSSAPPPSLRVPRELAPPRASAEKQLTRFVVLGVEGTIGPTDISVLLPQGTDVTSLTPTVDFVGASVSPASGQAVAFTSPVTYTVTAANGTTRAWRVTVTVAPSSAKAITRFTVAGVDGTITGSAILVELPAGTSLSGLTPTVDFTGLSLSPASGAAQTFSGFTPYVVTAADGSTATYTVLVMVAGADAFDLSQVAVYNSPADVASWAITTQLTRLEMQSAGGAGLSFDFPALSSWPDYTPPGWGGALQYTVWAVVKVNGAWCTSGFIQMWNGRGNTGAPLLTDFALNWAYDGRWGPMMGYQPQVGELWGFFVTAGNARGVPDVTSLRERSNLVVVPLPAGDTGVFRF